MNIDLAQLLDELQPLSEDDRTARLNAVVLSPDLRLKIYRMLCCTDNADETPGALINQARRELDRIAADASAYESASSQATAASELAPGATIGRFEIVRRIGEGGFSFVYHAKQTDTIHRDVALKILKPGMDSEHILLRFARERTALSQMDHPSIVPILDAGQTPIGRPYFVMPLIDDAATITSWCDEQRLDLRQRVQLLIQVCRAVEHAHQRLTVHRDLKPSNILIGRNDAQHIPRIIDFGIAKVLTPEPDDQSTATAAFPVVGTPAYMSPEQASVGAPVDTRSDVYSLGAILFELCCGERLLSDAGQGPTPADIVRRLEANAPASPRRTLARIMSQDTERAAAIASARSNAPARLLQQLHRDLDWIVARAVEIAPGARYASIAALREDLERWLENLPVAAARPSRLYRARKLILRHRALASVTAVSAILLLAATIVMAAMMFRALRAERLADIRAVEATSEAERADETAGLLESMLTAISPAEAQGVDTELLKLMMARAAERLDADASISTNARAAVLHAMGSGYRLAGMQPAGLDALKRALALRESLLGPTHPKTLDTMEELLLLHSSMGEHERAIELARTVHSARTASFGSEAPDTLTALNNLGLVLVEAGQYAEAQETLESAHALRVKVHGEAHPLTLSTINNLAMALQRRGELESARLLLRQARDGFSGASKVVVPEALTVLHNLGIVSRLLKDLEEAAQAMEEALSGRQTILGSGHPETIQSITSLALLREEQQRLDEAEPLHLEAVSSSKAELGGRHPITLASLNNLAGFYQTRRRQPDLAEPIFCEVLQLTRAQVGDAHNDTLISLSNLATCLNSQGKYAEALPMYEEAAALSVELHPGGHFYTGVFLTGVGAAKFRLGDVEQAEPILLEAFDMLSGQLGAEHPRTRRAADVLRELYKSRQRSDLAELWAQRAAPPTPKP